MDFNPDAPVPTMREEIRRLIEQADEELRVAHELMEHGHYSFCAFFCQQAVEKRLKAAILIENKEAPYKSHDLRTLVGQLRKVDGAILSKCLRINPHYTTSRYPDAANGVPYKQYDKALAAELYSDAKDIFTYLEARAKK